MMGRRMMMRRKRKMMVVKRRRMMRRIRKGLKSLTRTRRSRTIR